jgi:hypothetical protein
MTTIKRHANPHISSYLSSIEPVSRQDIYAHDAPFITSDIYASSSLNAAHHANAVEAAVMHLDKLVEKEIFIPSCPPSTGEHAGVSVPEDIEKQEKDVFEFRLISALLPPRSVRLRRAEEGPRKSIPRFTSAEDTPAEAEERRKKALAVAVDLDLVLASAKTMRTRVSRKEKVAHQQGIAHTKRSKKLLCASTVSEGSASSLGHLALLSSDKSGRKTRPPVAAHRLAYHPYKTGVLNPDEGGATYANGGLLSEAVDVKFV